MKFIKCKWEKDTFGFYILPLLGFSKIKGAASLWIGWLYWLFTIQLNKPS
jgi:hypothetical protein